MNPVINPSVDQIPHTAWDEAGDAAARARIETRELQTFEECARLFEVFDSIWRPRREAQPVTTEILRAMSLSDSYVVGAFRDSTLVGGSAGFFGPPGERTLHSHITGITADARNSNAGYTLKLHQRAWALDRGVETITWTFDPLQRRNAYFNLCKLGTRPVAYLTNFYGPMLDAINGHDESDRLLVAWSLLGTERDPAVISEKSQDLVHLEADSSGAPVLSPAQRGGSRIELPASIDDIRQRDPQLAQRWRAAVRTALEPALASGAAVRFNPAGHYEVGSR